MHRKKQLQQIQNLINSIATVIAVGHFWFGFEPFVASVFYLVLCWFILQIHIDLCHPLANVLIVRGVQFTEFIARSGIFHVLCCFAENATFTLQSHKHINENANSLWSVKQYWFVRMCCTETKKNTTSLQLIVEINWNGGETAAAAVATMALTKTFWAREFDSIIEGKLSDK